MSAWTALPWWQRLLALLGGWGLVSAFTWAFIDNLKFRAALRARRRRFGP